MKVIAFFDLKEQTDVRTFHRWVRDRQTAVFKRWIPRMSHFCVLSVVEADNRLLSRQMVQLFDWEGTGADWQETLDSFTLPENSELYGLAQEWLSMCVDESTRILYAESVEPGT